ncbi:ornithine decarboxylase [Amycolatopsis antarctica]|uniref:ornithine decarboxylase n=1 Tax=Amycolatopsis antarctica TaxID=1854586 RepID=A0A263D8P0_9PSEU|nr:type III PLP-dependent enzyme [Amycolatopsis antarctica]OZM74559.1 ornithine decarboxylase [Amycolatopsis antarctica]
MPDTLRRFLDEHAPPTPCLVVDVDAVLAAYRRTVAAFPAARVFYAVKANPAPAVVATLVAAGAGFDVASPAEADLCLRLGADPASLSYGNTIKKAADVAYAHALGVREFVTDAADDLANIVANAPAARVTVRLGFDGPASATPFGRKFGCDSATAAELLTRAHDEGLLATGIGFHVGSQQLDPAAWDGAIATAAEVSRALPERVPRPVRLNVGGGFAVPYTGPAPSRTEYAAVIGAAVRRHFGAAAPELVLEPGRLLVAEAGRIRTEVVLVARRSPGESPRWVYLDIGRYNGMAEAENEAIAYRFEPVSAHGEDGPVILAGPTCDGDDVLYQHTPYRLPLSLRSGDLLDIPSTGAYTASYSSVSFNGIAPLRTYCLSGGKVTDDG